MNLINPDTYAQVLFEICTYMYLKRVHVSLTIRAKNQSSTKTKVLLFHKRFMYPFHMVQILDPLCWILICVVCVGKGAVFMLLIFVMYFLFEVRAKNQIIFLPNKQNLADYFHQQHSNTNIY